MTVSFTQSWVFETKRLLIIENLDNIDHAFQGRPSIFIGGGGEELKITISEMPTASQSSFWGEKSLCHRVSDV